MKPLSLLAVAALSAPLLADGHWPAWRGPLGTGESTDADPPVEWSEDENIRWKVPLPGRAKGTPIIWGDHVIVLTAEGFGEEVELEEPEDERERRRWMRAVHPKQQQRFQVMALDRKDGSVVWSTTVGENLPHEGTHGDGSWASASALTDGERIYAQFGSNGLFALDMDGEVLWEKQLGKMKTRNAFGEGASPSVHGDTLVVPWDHEGPSFIVGLDATTGEEKWRQERDEPTSWATPLIVEVDGEMQVVTNGTNKVRSYNLETGELIWDCGGMTLNAIPTPVHADGVAYLMSGFRGNALMAIRLEGAAGDLEGTDAILWEHGKNTPYVPSPLLVGNRLYFTKSNDGILSVFDVANGESVFGPERLQSVANVYASPVAAAGRVYFVGRDGEIEVRADAPDCPVLATNKLDDEFDTSPALVDGELYLRGEKSLYCIAKDE